jgi:hypothetical protein
MIRLAHYFNKTILVCIPSVFEDEQPRPFKLIGIEDFGLWLESEELTRTLQSGESTQSSQVPVAAFFPFSHIAYAMAETHSISLAPKPVASTESKEPQRHHDERPSKHEQRHKTSTSHGKRKK